MECGGPSLYRMVPGVAGLLLGVVGNIEGLSWFHDMSHTDQKKGSLDILEKQASHDSIFQVLANHRLTRHTIQNKWCVAFSDIILDQSQNFLMMLCSLLLA